MNSIIIENVNASPDNEVLMLIRIIISQIGSFLFIMFNYLRLGLKRMPFLKYGSTIQKKICIVCMIKLSDYDGNE